MNNHVQDIEVIVNLNNPKELLFWSQELKIAPYRLVEAFYKVETKTIEEIQKYLAG